MFVKLFSICAVVQLVVSQDLPITFKDGKIGVNFGGYHAEAGLGGLLTGDAAHGGLTASAGTPFGQTAHAGLGGNTGTNSRGGLFAGASAGNGVGASASLAGDLSNGGSFGVGDAEAHAGGISKSVTKTVSTNVETNVGPTVDLEAPVVVEPSALQIQAKPHSIETQTQSVIKVPTTTYLAPEAMVGSVPALLPTYLPTSEQAQGEKNVDTDSSSVSSSSIDKDDNDLTDNKVPQLPPVQQQTVTQVVNPPATINVQKIKVRPRPHTYTVVQKQVQLPSYFTYQKPAIVKQIPIPVYQPAVFHKRIQITAPYQVVQRIDEVQAITEGPTTTTSSTTPRPPYVYTYDKQKVINEIFSIPIHALRAVNEIINAKLAGGYSIQKTITYN